MIRVLAPDVAARIAAGEVVERPASIVKELLENALDAGARRVDVELAGGGIDLVRVSDDGCGIPAEEVALAFERHATSKIRDDDDLRALRTLGFRGEALPSIAAVARVGMSTRHAAEAVGTAIGFQYGRLSERRSLGRAVGTSVAVAELFGELPARKKFLKPRGTEAAAAMQVVTQYALAYPEVRFALRSDGREIFATPGDGDQRAAVAATLGAELARQMLTIQPVTARDGGSVFAAVNGLIGPVSTHRANRSGLSVFLNRRWVQHRVMAAVIEEAYETLIPAGRHPVAVIFITVPPEEADFNVHPAKSEARLLRERAIANVLHRAVLETLAAHSGPAIWGGGDSQEGGERLADLRVLGQVSATYIIAEGAAGLYLVDQHAAHERIMLERYRERLGRAEAAQLLLEPVAVEMDDGQASLALEQREALAGLGFELEEFGPRGLLLRSVPALATGHDAAALLRSVLESAIEQDGASDWREKLALSLSCHTAIRAGDVLQLPEMEALVRQLGEAELCRTCSHGRPTAILLSHSQLEKEFGRR